MAYYRICPCCGAALDPGERCDCTRESSSVTYTDSSEKILEVYLSADPERQAV